MISPTSYQGGKQRIAGQILDIINPDPDTHFYDLCCGSGAISIELVNRGHSLEKIHMLDKAPWGLFWQMIGEGAFDLNLFKEEIDLIPKDIAKIQGYVKDLSKRPANFNTVYVYLILQASSFGGKAIWIENNQWRNCSFRSYWLPTATSNRRSHVNPMMPMPETLFQRVGEICQKMKGIHGYYADIESTLPEDGIVYIDPPYDDTTAYGMTFDVVGYANKLKTKCYISEGKPLFSESYLISQGRKKGGISGERVVAHEEWLSTNSSNDLPISFCEKNPVAVSNA